MAHFSFVDETSSWADVAGYNPEGFRPVDDLGESLLRGPSELTPQEREFIAAYVSGLNACEYCYGSHSAIAEAFGADKELLDRLVQTDDLGLVETQMRPILDLARTLTLTPARVAKADIDAIVAAGWSERTAHDAVCVIAFFNYANRIIDGHGLRGSAKYFASAANALGPGGSYRDDAGAAKE